MKSTIPLDVLANLSTKYSEPHRHYHNLNHIHRCLSIVNNTNLFKTGFVSTKYEMLEVAIWFHDVIYNPYAKNNEVESGLLAKDFLEKHPLMQLPMENFPKEEYISKTVASAIYATSAHTSDQDRFLEINAYAMDIDVIHAMLDIDLVGLADPWEQYRSAGKAIRKEYSHLNDEEFSKGRKDFLEKMLNRKSIYYRKDFHKKYEAAARRNLESEYKLDETLELLKKRQEEYNEIRRNFLHRDR